MDDFSSVYKICPHCGQSVSVGAKFCPTCGTPFEENEMDFTAYERYSSPEQQNLDLTREFQSVSEAQNGEGIASAVFLQTAAAQGGTDAASETFRIPEGAVSVEQAAPDTQNPQDSTAQTGQDPDGSAQSGTAATMAETAVRGAKHETRQSGGSGGNTPPPMGGRQQNPNGDRKKTGLVVTIVAAVLLVAVIVVGVVMAFNLGIFGRNSDSDDVMTLAQEAYDNQEYASAISQLEQMIRTDTASVSAYELLADAYSANGDPEGAADAYLRGYQDTGDSTLKKAAVDAYIALGNQARTDGDNAAARLYYNTVLEQLDASNSAAIAALATLEQQSPSASPSASASPSPSASVSAETESGISPPSAGEYGTITESEEAVATPTPTPDATPTPTVKPSTSSAADTGTASGSSSSASGASGGTSSGIVSSGGGSSTSSTSGTGSSSSSASGSSSSTSGSSTSSGSAASASTSTPAAASSSSASSEPSPSPSPAETTFELEDHTYEIVISDCTWWTAYKDAAEQGGHLVTINSEEEFEACAELAEANEIVFLWLGMTLGDEEAWEDRIWISGEELEFAPWYEDEPSGGEEEKYLAMFLVDEEWYFNDTENVVEDYAGKKGYIIEYDNEDLAENAD